MVANDKENPAKIRLITFNIRCCDDPDGYSVAERAPRLAEVTRRYDADVICFQEYRPIWEEPIARYYSGAYDMVNKYRNQAEDKESSPILWRRDRFDCLKTGYFWLSDTPEQESRGWDELYNCYRMCLYAVLLDKHSGKTFTVMNTHFGFGDRGQVRSAKLITSYSREISDFPTLVTGDFNMTPNSPGYAQMTAAFRDANIAKDWRSTYHGYHPETVTNEHIDYCFICPKITPVDQVIITDTVEGKYPSDHFGLYTTLVL